MWECEGCDDGALVKALQSFFTFIVIDYRRLARWRLAIIGDHAGDTFRVMNLYRNGSGLRALAGSSGLHIPSLSTTCSLEVGYNWGPRRRCVPRNESVPCWFRITCRIFWRLHMPSSGSVSCSINRVQGTFDAERSVCPLVHFMARMLAYETRFRLLYVCWWIPKNFSFPLLFSESLYTRFYCVQVRFP